MITGLSLGAVLFAACLSVMLVLSARLHAPPGDRLNGHGEHELRHARADRRAPRRGLDRAVHPAPRQGVPVRRGRGARIPRDRRDRGRLGRSGRPGRRRSPACSRVPGARPRPRLAGRRVGSLIASPRGLPGVGAGRALRRRGGRRRPGAVHARGARGPQAPPVRQPGRAPRAGRSPPARGARSTPNWSARWTPSRSPGGRRRRLVGFAMGMGRSSPASARATSTCSRGRPSGELGAVMHFIAHRGKLSLDTMRRVGETPNGLNEALVCHALGTARRARHPRGEPQLRRTREPGRVKPSAAGIRRMRAWRLRSSAAASRWSGSSASTRSSWPQWRPRYLGVRVARITAIVLCSPCLRLRDTCPNRRCGSRAPRRAWSPRGPRCPGLGPAWGGRPRRGVASGGDEPSSGPAPSACAIAVGSLTLIVAGRPSAPTPCPGELRVASRLRKRGPSSRGRGTGRLLQVDFYSRCAAPQGRLHGLPVRPATARPSVTRLLPAARDARPATRVRGRSPTWTSGSTTSSACATSKPMILVYPDGRIDGDVYSDSEWANTPSGNFESYVIDVMTQRRAANFSHATRLVRTGSSPASRRAPYGAINIALHHLFGFRRCPGLVGLFHPDPVRGLRPRRGRRRCSPTTARWTTSARSGRASSPATRCTCTCSSGATTTQRSSCRWCAPLVPRLEPRSPTQSFPAGTTGRCGTPRLNQMLILASQDVTHPLRSRERVPNDARVFAGAPARCARRAAPPPGRKGAWAPALRRGSPRAPAPRRSAGPAGPRRAAAPAGGESVPVSPGARVSRRRWRRSLRSSWRCDGVAWRECCCCPSACWPGSACSTRSVDCGWFALGPHIRDSLPLLQLAGFDGQPIGRVAAAWLPIGYAFGLAVPRAKPLWLALGAAAFGALLLVAASNASFALADNLRLTAVLWHRLPPLGPWLEAGLFAHRSVVAGGACAAGPTGACTGRWGRACAPPYRLIGGRARDDLDG